MRAYGKWHLVGLSRVNPHLVGLSLTVCGGGSSGDPSCVEGVTVARPVSRVLVLDSARHASRLCGLRSRIRTHS